VDGLALESQGFRHEEIVNLECLRLMARLAISVVRGVGPRDLKMIVDLTRVRFPMVEQVTTAQLNHWMQFAEKLLLVDVRSPDEFQVSHLQGARNLRSVSTIAEVIDLEKPQRTVLYCTVGYRSSVFARRLSEIGSPAVSNLEGSIVQWSNDGRPLYRESLLVHEVHPYNRLWSGLLRSENVNPIA
jgi:rhodanese-related sulfurtransferase